MSTMKPNGKKKQSKALAISANSKNKKVKISSFLNRTNQRVEISQFVKQFQRMLDKQWDDYQIAISLFIVGKLSREELMTQISPVLSKKETRRMHNQLLVSILTNCYKGEPLDGSLSTIFGNSSKKRILGNQSSQYEELKKDILSLSVRDRVRIKSIVKDSNKKGRVQNVLILSRQAMVPKVPIVTSQSKDSNNSSNRTHHIQDTLISVNDILKMVDEPLCSESYELPERSRMRNIMLGLARENGLLGNVSMKAVDLLYIGLQYHLKSIIGNVIDNVRSQDESSEDASKNTESINRSVGKTNFNVSGNSKFDSSTNTTTSTVNESTSHSDVNSTSSLSSSVSRTSVSPHKNENKKNITITAEDLFDSFTLAPHLIQPYGTIDYLTDVTLKNDDDYDFVSRRVKNMEQNLHSNSASSSKSTIRTTDEITITDDIGINNDQYTYLIPNKVTDISYLLKSKEELQENKDSSTNAAGGIPKINLALSDKNIGTPDELNWVINGLLADDM